MSLDDERARVPIRVVRGSAQQLTLQFPLERHFTAAEFHAAPSNAAALAWLENTGSWPNLRLALWGASGRGKTHLLHIWIARIGAVMISGRSLQSHPDPAGLAGIALDDADSLPDETALFHLLNAAGEARVPVLMASRNPPARWAIDLPDLASRLRAVTAVEIEPPEDDLLRTLLTRLAAERRISMPEVVHTWLLQRLPRTPAALREAVARLDAASLAEHRAITVPLAREVLAGLLDPAEDELSGTTAPPSRDQPPVL